MPNAINMCSYVLLITFGKGLYTKEHSSNFYDSYAWFFFWTCCANTRNSWHSPSKSPCLLNWYGRFLVASNIFCLNSSFSVPRHQLWEDPLGPYFAICCFAGPKKYKKWKDAKGSHSRKDALPSQLAATWTGPLATLRDPTPEGVKNNGASLLVLSFQMFKWLFWL